MTSRAELILAQAKRAKNVEECAAVGRAVSEAAVRVDRADEMDLLDKAIQIARDTFESYRTRRVISIRSLPKGSHRSLQAAEGQRWERK